MHSFVMFGDTSAELMRQELTHSIVNKNGIFVVMKSVSDVLCGEFRVVWCAIVYLHPSVNVRCTDPMSKRYLRSKIDKTQHVDMKAKLAFPGSVRVIICLLQQIPMPVTHFVFPHTQWNVYLRSETPTR